MPFQNFKQTNLAKATLSASISAATTSIALQSGQGGLFPSTFPFNVLIQSLDSQERPLKNEIARCTARVADVLTVVRAVEAVPASYSATTQTQTPFAFDSNDSVSLVLTANQQKDVQDEISRLETDKLDKAGGYRTGLTPKRVLITDSSGVETQLSGTLGQVVGFDGSGTPIATTPSTDINGLAESTSFADADAYVKYDSGAAANRKSSLPTARAEIGAYFFGDGSDGDLSVSSGTTTLAATSDEVFKQYRNLSVTSTGILACAGKINHIYVSGTLTISGTGKIHANGYGGAGGIGGDTNSEAGTAGTNGNGIDWATVSGRDFYAGGGSGGAGGGATTTGWTAGASGTFKANERGRVIRISVGAGGGGAGRGFGTGNGGNGGAGGGVLIIIANRVNVTGGTISANGVAGSNGASATNGGAGGGGGGGGSIALLYGTLVSDTGTWQCNGGNGGNSFDSGTNSASGGGGGGGGYGVAGGAGGAGTSGSTGNPGGTASSNAYGTGGTGGTTENGTSWIGGGGGGGAPGVYYKAKARIN